jgi:type IV pilus assembly protein PilY1
MKTNYSFAAWVVVLAGLAPVAAWGQLVVTDDFTKGSATASWQAFNGACLTAGDGSGTIPACIVGNAELLYYGNEQLVGGNSGTLPDPSGQGALRFTNGRPGGYHQNGAIVLNPTQAFPTDKGVQVTFTTVTYRGDSGGGGRDGADGISFFLMDGSVAPDLGAFGGSLGYTCSNTNNDPTVRADGTQRGYDGLVGAYLGLGIDEFGNFLNGSNPLTGYNGDNTASGYGYVPGRIGLRGAGNVAWRWLNQNYPREYPTFLTTAQRASAVQKTCSTGTLWDFRTPADPVPFAPRGRRGRGRGRGAPQPLDYPAIPNAFSVLSGVQIANEAAVTRTDGTPITYKLKITAGGLLSLSYSVNSGTYLPIMSGQDITASNGNLPGSFLFGFAGSTGGDTNIHEIMCFRASPNDQSASSAGVNQQQTAKVQAGAQVYFAYYNPDTWAGSLTAQNITLDPVTNAVTGISAPIWDASCVLTGTGAAEGATCPSTGQPSPVPEPPASRTILTWNGSQGTAFEWGTLTPAQQAALDVGDGSQTANRLNFLRGDRTNEEPITGPTGTQIYRDRASVLGDIIDSSPTWVGPPSSPFGAVFTDKINAGGGFPENSGQSYPTFKSSSAQTRLNVVYTGANDGLLHGFRTGAYTAANTFNPAAPNDGLEVLAYMPGAVISGINNIRGNNIPPNITGVDSTLDFSDPKYGHNFFVDATPGSGDLFYGGIWHTWLVGGLGAGGAVIYALDVTDSSPTTFAESNAKNLVIGEWSSTTIPCVNVGGCGANLGNTYGVPQIRRFHNGQWGAVFGNGLNTANGSAGIFVMLVDASAGTETFYYLGTNGTAAGNGIAFATPVDLDGDNIIDFVYAGDVKGNIWRFDLTSSNPASWAAASTPLFTTPGGQPITTKLIVASTPANSGPPRIMVDFGTGSQSPFTNTSQATYATGGQSLYGVWDWNLGGLSGWNAMSSTQYASLVAPQAVSVANLEAQTITTSGTTRSITSNPVCWQGSTTCSSGNNQFGWVVALPAGSEQVVFSPILEVGLFIVNTLIPATNSPLTCASQLASGFTMAISPTTGGSFTNSVFADPTTGSFLTKNISGMQWSGTGSGSIVTGGGTGTLGSNVYFITQTVSGSPLPPQQINPPGGRQGGRLTWIERR